MRRALAVLVVLLLSGCGIRWGEDGTKGSRPKTMSRPAAAYLVHADVSRGEMTFTPLAPSPLLGEPLERVVVTKPGDLDLKNKTAPSLSGGIFSGEVYVRNFLADFKRTVNVVVQWIQPTSVTVYNEDGRISGKPFWRHDGIPPKSGNAPGKVSRLWQFEDSGGVDFDFCVFLYAWKDTTVGGNPNLYDIHVLDDQTAVAVGSYGIYRTTDGGRTWSGDLSGTGGRFDAVDFYDSLHGWAVGTGGKIYYTEDGGASWTRQDSGVAVDLTDVACIDAYNAWAVGKRPGTGQPGTILKWDGSKWQPQNCPVNQNLWDVFFLDSSRGWVAGTYYILRTSDGGAHWTASPSLGRKVNGVEFADASRGWAVGTGGYIWESTDGGESWTQVGEGLTSSDLYAVHIKPDGSIVVVGQGGVILKHEGGAWTVADILPKDLYDCHLIGSTIWVAAGNGSVYIW